MRVKGLLTEPELEILNTEIRKNSKRVSEVIFKIDLLVNKEGHDKSSSVVIELREELGLLMQENDTFRRTLWKHVETEESTGVSSDSLALEYITSIVKTRDKYHAFNLGYE